MRPRLEAIPGGPIPLRSLLYQVHWASLVTSSDHIDSRCQAETEHEQVTASISAMSTPLASTRATAQPSGAAATRSALATAPDTPGAAMAAASCPGSWAGAATPATPARPLQMSTSGVTQMTTSTPVRTPLILSQPPLVTVAMVVQGAVQTTTARPDFTRAEQRQTLSSVLF